MRRLADAFLCAALLAAAPALAATTCNGSGVSLSLGIYDANQGVPLDSSGIFTVSCFRDGGPPNTVVTVGLGASLNSGTIASRHLRHASSADILQYNFYRDASRSTVWGNTLGNNTVSQTISLSNNSGGTLTFTLFARIDALQDVRPGFYSDSLTLTVNF